MLAFYTTPVFNLPTGPKNLAGLFPAIDFNNVAEYYVELKDGDNLTVFRSNIMKTGCCCSPERVRVHFLNAVGFFDAVNFNPPRIVHPTSSAEYKVPLGQPFNKTDSSTVRFNVRSNELYEVMTDCYGEGDMEWLKELADSPQAFMEWKGIEGQPDSYLPILIMDKDHEVRKNGDEFLYQFRLSFKFSNENIIQRS